MRYPRDYDTGGSRRKPIGGDKRKTGNLRPAGRLCGKAGPQARYDRTGFPAWSAGASEGRKRTFTGNLGIICHIWQIPCARAAFFVFRGRVVQTPQGLAMEQPAVLGREDYQKLLHTRQPVYNLTAGLTNKAMAKAVQQALDSVPVQKDYLPEEIRKGRELAEYNYAIRTHSFSSE